MSDELIAKIDKAHKVVCDLCSGKRKWIMSIPAQPNDDPDLIIGESLREARAEIISLHSRVEELEAGDRSTYCAYCGQSFPADASDSAELVGEHILACEKHPIFQLRQQVAALEDRNLDYDVKCTKLRNELIAAESRATTAEAQVKELIEAGNEMSRQASYSRWIPEQWAELVAKIGGKQ